MNERPLTFSKPLRRRSLQATVLGAVLVLSFTASGYILPSSSILRRMAEARDEQPLTALRVEGTVVFSGAAAQSAGTALGIPAERPELAAEGAVLLKLPGRCRLEASASDTAKAIAAVDVNRRKRSEGTEQPAMQAAIGQLCPLLGSRAGSDSEARAGLERYLASMKIDPRKTSLGRFAGQVAYVLGDPAEGQPQLWVYKDTFLPARVRFPAAEGGSWDVRFVDFNSPATGESFPRVVEVYRDGEPQLRFTGVRADSHPRLEEKLF